MEKQELIVSDDITAVHSNFSDYIVCVEIKKNGEIIGSFCSDTSQFKEWDTEEYKDLIKSHVKQIEKAEIHNEKNLHRLSNGLEIRFHKHWEDFYCVDVIDKGREIGSFCADRASFEEWMEDKEYLEEVIHKQLKLE